MDTTPPGEETPKDYATRRIDLEQPESASENAAQKPRKNPALAKHRRSRSSPPQPAPAVTIPVRTEAASPSPPPAPPPASPGSTPKNERIWIAAIIGICVVALACICSCTIVAAFFLNNAALVKDVVARYPPTGRVRMDQSSPFRIWFFYRLPVEGLQEVNP